MQRRNWTSQDLEESAWMRYWLTTFLIKALFSMEISRQNKTNVLYSICIGKTSCNSRLQFYKGLQWKGNVLIVDFMLQIRKMPFSKLHVFKDTFPSKHSSSWRRLEDVFRFRLQKTSSRRFQDIFKTSSRRLAKTSLRHLQDVLQRCLQEVFKTYHQVKLFLLICFWDVLQSKGGYLQKDLPRSHFWEIYGQCTKFARVTKVSQVLVFHFTTPFSGCLQRRI